MPVTLARADALAAGELFLLAALANVALIALGVAAWRRGAPGALVWDLIGTGTAMAAFSAVLLAVVVVRYG